MRELVRTRRAATPAEVQQILAHMAAAPFDPRDQAVPATLQGVSYLGRTLGPREPRHLVLLVQRVIGDSQWAYGTTEAEYLADLRAAVRHMLARLVVYERRGGFHAATLTPTAMILPIQRRGPQWLPLLYVVHSADRGTISSGYQASALTTLSIPGDALWLN